MICKKEKYPKERKISKKLKIVTFFCILLLLFIHRDDDIETISQYREKWERKAQNENEREMKVGMGKNRFGIFISI